jgi:hypothetical protein
MWIKAEKPVEKTGQVTSQAQKKKHLSPSTRKRNVQRINQWKAKRNEAVGDSKTCAHKITSCLGRSLPYLCQCCWFVEGLFVAV